MLNALKCHWLLKVLTLLVQPLLKFFLFLANMPFISQPVVPVTAFFNKIFSPALEESEYST